MKRVLIIGTLAWGLWGCAHHEIPHLTVAVHASEALYDRMAEGVGQEADGQYSFDIVELPSGENLSISGEMLEAQLDRAERHYINADFAACMTVIGEELLVASLLEAGRRDLAARVLYWRVACRTAQLRITEARADARRLVALGLRLPPGTVGATPEAEALFDDAFRESQDATTVDVGFRSSLRGLQVGVDGRRRVCQVPCGVELMPGEHVLYFEYDGYQSRVQVEQITGPRIIEVELERASPEEAGRQWAARYSNLQAMNSGPSLRLLAQAMGARRLVLFRGDASGPEVTLRAALAIDGEYREELERRARLSELERESSEVFEELLLDSQLLSRPIYSRAGFWVGIGGAILVSVGLTLFLLHEPDETYSIRFAGPEDMSGTP